MGHTRLVIALTALAALWACNRNSDQPGGQGQEGVSGGPVAKHLVALQEARDPEELLSAALALVRSSEPGAVDGLLEILQDPETCNRLDPGTDVKDFFTRCASGKLRL